MRGYVTEVLQLIPGAEHSRQALCNILSEATTRKSRDWQEARSSGSQTHYWISNVTEILTASAWRQSRRPCRILDVITAKQGNVRGIGGVWRSCRTTNSKASARQ